MKAIGIDLGGHFIKGALVEEGSVTTREKTPTPESRCPDEVVRTVSAMISRLDPGGTARGVGVGFPGMLDRGREKVLQAPNFPLIENYPFRSRVSRACGREVYLENDANCAALGEGADGAAKGLTDFAMFTLGTGIGGGIVSGGRLLTGAYGKAAELGHLAVGDGTECGCGAPGHAEAVFGADALKRSFAKARIKGNLPDLWKRRDEPEVALVWGRALDVLARLVASVVHVLDPQAVILGGGFSRNQGFVETLEPLVINYTAPPFRKTLDIRLSALGDDAALIGATTIWGQTLK
ncbi:MAG: ROK family protein [Thermovirgaceae bacterium]|jgi:glucokinase|nr:ROK family protein [Synergistales bacterium]MDD5515313.1 ROK family protein [Synergistales bacterium]HPQ78495.1 ROK family protein [Synergistales bacterium]